MKYILYTISLFILMMFTSCLKDLELFPKDPNVYTSEKAWREEGTYLAVLAKIYASFGLNGQNAPSEGFDIQGGDQGEATFTRSYWNLQEMCTDETLCAWSDNGIDGMNYIQWNSNNRFGELVYNRCLVTIAFCNEYLAQTTDDKLSERGMSHLAAKVAGYRAEVRAVRALKYMLLMDLYANVPFADYIGSTNPPQKDRAFLFNFVETELVAVVGQLPEVSHQTYARFTKGAAYMTLAKLYLNAEVYVNTPKYTECITACQQVIAQGYELEPQYKHLFMADNYKSKEIIFPIVQDGQKAPSYAGTTYLIAASYNAAMNINDNAGLKVDGWQGLRSRPQLVDLFDNNDKRATFYTTGFTKEINNVGEFIQGYPVIKFVNKNQDGTRGSHESFSDVDVTFYRLADVYLMLAEAELRKDNAITPTTLALVNQLRTRAGVTGFSSSLSLNDILDERARELHYEGHRRTDLIRFGKFTKGYNWAWKNRIKEGSDVDDKYKIYPIPASDLSANPNLKQNPGY